jgi:hypothetical protein
MVGNCSSLLISNAGCLGLLCDAAYAYNNLDWPKFAGQSYILIHDAGCLHPLMHCAAQAVQIS